MKNLELFELKSVLKKAKDHIKKEEYFEARAYLKRAYFLFPWKQEIVNLLEDVSAKLEQKPKVVKKRRR
ncbi:MAG TPA: hypothetical protein ENG13_04465 [bacterium]|nr:hypothetical protein [bacterium]HEX68299.1 hypothetical protein [bacterium]